MKLLHIASNDDNCIEEALVPVPDDFDREVVLGDVADVVRDPYIKSVFVCKPAPGHVNHLSEYRSYFG